MGKLKRTGKFQEFFGFPELENWLTTGWQRLKNDLPVVLIHLPRVTGNGNPRTLLKVFETANSYASTFVYFSIVCTIYVHYINISVPILTYIIFIEFISISAEVGNTVIQIILLNLY